MALFTKQLTPVAWPGKRESEKVNGQFRGGGKKRVQPTTGRILAQHRTKPIEMQMKAHFVRQGNLKVEAW